jgi:hypothetical protein
MEATAATIAGIILTCGLCCFCFIMINDSILEISGREEDARERERRVSAEDQVMSASTANPVVQV